MPACFHTHQKWLQLEREHAADTAWDGSTAQGCPSTAYSSSHPYAEVTFSVCEITVCSAVMSSTSSAAWREDKGRGGSKQQLCVTAKQAVHDVPRCGVRRAASHGASIVSASKQDIQQPASASPNPEYGPCSAALARPQHLASAQCALALQTVRGTRHACPVQWTSQHLRGRRFRRTNHTSAPHCSVVRLCHTAQYARRVDPANPRNACPSSQLRGVMQSHIPAPIVRAAMPG